MKAEPIDLFEQYELQPPELREITTRYGEDWEDSYENCASMLRECEAIGYTFEYYLDAVPYDLRKMSPDEVIEAGLRNTEDFREKKNILFPNI